MRGVPLPPVAGTAAILSDQRQLTNQETIALIARVASLKGIMSKNTLTEAQNKYWYGYAQYRVYVQIERNDERTAVNEAFTAGARWAIRESSELSPHIAKFIEMMILLGVLDAEENLALEAERNSPLWHTARAGTPDDSAEPPY